MSYANRRAGRDPWKFPKAGWLTYHQLGAEVARQLPKHCTLEKLGQAIGTSKQNAYHESVVALGKVCYRLRQLRAAELD